MAEQEWDELVYHVPHQKAPPPMLPPNMAARLSTYPPLGQVTQLKSGKLTVVALLEVPKARAAEEWQVSLWHVDNEATKQWQEVPLAPSGDKQKLPLLQKPDDSVARLQFSAALTVPSGWTFTAKFKTAQEQEWRWIRDEQGLGDGVVVVNDEVASQSAGKDPMSSLTTELKDLIPDLNPDLAVKSLLSQSPNTQLWSVEATVPGTDTDDSALLDTPLGLPWGTAFRWFALVRIWPPWLAPRQGKRSFQLNEKENAVLLSFMSTTGRHLVLLAISGINDVLTTFQSVDGKVVIRSKTDATSTSKAVVLVAVGDSFEGANAAVMYQARNVVAAASTHSAEETAELAALRDGVKPEWYENWYDGLGFCTWNALGQRLTEDKVVNAVDELAKNDINITTLIIDDNWQNIDYQGDGQFQHAWIGFEAEPNTFPNGLKGAISKIRSKHKHIEHIAVWHALLGYWGGINGDGEIAQKYKLREVIREDANRRWLPLGGKMNVVDASDVNRFYNDFYKFLSDSGIDAVKTDGQFMMDTWISAKVRRELLTAYQDAWTLASLRHFSIKAISCMSQTPQILFHSQLPRNRPAILVRNSDDFFPHIPESHPWHVWVNAHNALFTQHLNALPDWDMFQTVHDYSAYHAAARCVSGGPIYITDTPGEHDIGLIKQMTGVTPRGKTVIFRPSVLGRTAYPYTDYNDSALLKITSYHGLAVTGTPILGVFNTTSSTVAEIVSLAAFNGIVPSLTYIVRAHTSGTHTGPITVHSAESRFPLLLPVRGYEILTAYPLHAFSSDSKGRVFAGNLGLIGKMTGAAAILNSDFVLRENGSILFTTRLKALGVLGIYISTLPDLTIEGDFMATIQGQPIPVGTVSKSKDSDFILEIDIEAAWKELGIQPGWSNEAEIKVNFPLEQ